jgi:hypothetical protein
MNKQIVYIDLDDTMCDFITPYFQKIREGHNRYPQSEFGFFI